MAVSTNAEKVAAFGIDVANMFGFWDWVGGRYSVDSAIGLSLMLSIGPDRFREFLDGFHRIDEHFRTAPLAENAPVILAMLGRLVRERAGVRDQGGAAVRRGARPVPGVSATARHGVQRQVGAPRREAVTGETGPIVWGEPGTNGQHAFYQLLHQGTRIVPADLIGFATPHHPYRHHHDLLMSNLIAQSEALAFGRDAAPGEPYRQFDGNRPNTVILAPQLTPSVLGQLSRSTSTSCTCRGPCGASTATTSGASNSARNSPTASPPNSPATPPDAHDAATNNLIAWYRAHR